MVGVGRIWGEMRETAAAVIVVMIDGWDGDSFVRGEQ